jgi:hypothetical protein
MVTQRKETDSPEVRPPFSALAMGSDQHRGFQHPAVRRSQAFSTSQRFAPPFTVVALFHATGTPGVLPFRGFPSLESVAPSDARSPPDITSRVRPCFPRQAAFRDSFPAQLPSGVYPSSQSVLPWSVLPFHRSRSSPGLGPLQGSPRFLDRHAFTHPPLPHFHAGSPRPKVWLPFARCPRVLLSQPVAGLSTLPKEPFQTAVLPGVYSLVTLDYLVESAPPWLMVSPQVPEYVTASCRTLFGPRSLRPQPKL